ncbi:heme-dependent oxidative N-demethylase family protein [Noviherbaspirillum aridicola]|uniref:Uncharacterized protein n=1 Tax=Noviherbaspirillum aridicola TaxID=2849687 RepID=A0ABQ4PZZ8_9BURK|nr:DUF3445 domain-containing protein [Noviherbaspirillum aridicola]GIZ50346.1 hypothetical protein NCCP691_03600 [Noviherbaspirillum aridicola]
MELHGVDPQDCTPDSSLLDALPADHMLRYPVVPKTVMINAWRPGMRWLSLDATYPPQIARRLALLRDRPQMVLGRLPGDEVRKAEIELRDSVMNALLADYPGHFRRDGDRVVSLLTGIAVDVGNRGADPLAAIALMASEDMLLLMPRPAADGAATYLLAAGALLFPNDWSLDSHFREPEPPETGAAHSAWAARRAASRRAARLGKTPREIHDGRVAHYMAHFADRVDQYFARMPAGSMSWRRNWGMRLTDELFLHADLSVEVPESSADNWAEHGYLRSEHETFTKLAGSGAVVFSIKTYLWKLSDLVREPSALAALLEADRNLSPLMAEYRADSLPGFRAFLARHAPPAGLP